MLMNLSTAAPALHAARLATVCRPSSAPAVTRLASAVSERRAIAMMSGSASISDVMASAASLVSRTSRKPSLGGDHTVRNELTLLAQAYARAALRYAFEMQGARLRLHRLRDERAQKCRRLVVRYGRLRRLPRRRRAFLLVRDISLRRCGVRSRRGGGISARIGRRRGAVRLFQADHRHIAMTCVLGGLLRKVFADAVTRDGVIGDEEMGVLF